MDAEPIAPADIPTFEHIRERVRDFIRRFFRDRMPGDDDDIFTPEFVNSLFAMQLINFVQQEFGITVEDEDLDQAHWQTINTISKFVHTKLLSA